MTTAYLGFGSNLGDRAAAIAAAVAELQRHGVALRALSPLYETEAITADPQPLFVNAAARVETALSAGGLLDACLEVERALGRVRPPGQVQAPREIDVDLLLYGTEVIRRGVSLIVPHPRLLERAFVRIPLGDVAEPGLVHPLTGEPLDRAAPDPGVRRLGGLARRP
jgi:2-amino-4-hydroxy-6-hydroxymethyldihydropteridine diphosphokinase